MQGALCWHERLKGGTARIVLGIRGWRVFFMVTISRVLMSSVSMVVIREDVTDAVVNRQQKRPGRDPCKQSNRLWGNEGFAHALTSLT